MSNKPQKHRVLTWDDVDFQTVVSKTQAPSIFGNTSQMYYLHVMRTGWVAKNTEKNNAAQPDYKVTDNPLQALGSSLSIARSIAKKVCSFYGFAPSDITIFKTKVDGTYEEVKEKARRVKTDTKFEEFVRSI